MKKYNEGYTLVLVLVVIFVLFTLSLAITSFSLNNLKNQMASVDRMTAKYEAMGEIEKIVGQLEQNITIEYADGSVSTELDDAAKGTLIKTTVEEKYQITLETVQVQPDENTFSYDAVLSVENNLYKATARITISGKIELTVENGKKVCKLTEIQAVYTSYEIGGATS